MNKTVRKSIILVAFVFLALGNMTAAFKFRSFDVSDGLADNSVECIGQDKDGYIWLGTRNGLCRFDGRDFITYRFKDDDASNMSSNRIHTLLVDSDSIWVGSFNGLYLFDIPKKRFSVCSYVKKDDKGLGKAFSFIREIIKVNNKVFVLGNDSNIYKNSGNGIFLQSALKPKNWFSICGYNDKYILAHGCNGLSLIDPSTETVIASAGIPAEIESKNLFFDVKRRLAFVSYGMSQKVETYSITRENKIIPFDSDREYYSDLVSSYDSDVLFGTNGQGLISLGDDGEKIYHSSGNAISGDVIASIFTDNENNLWVGTYRYGLNLYSPRFGWFSNFTMPEMPLSSRLATALAVKDNIMYVGTDGEGLDIMDLHTGRTSNYKKSTSGIAGDAILSIIEDSESLWMGSYADGLSNYDLKTKKFKSYPLKDKSIWSIADDGSGRIWVLGKDVVLFNKSAETFYVVSELKDVWASGVRFIGDEAWVFTSTQGIFVIDMSSMKVKRRHNVKSGLPSNAVSFLYIDSKNRIWIGYQNNGLYMSEPGKSFEEAQRVAGMEASNIMAMAEHDGYFWISSDKGLFRYDISKNHFSRFGKEDGLGSVQFLNCSYASEGGALYFGTTQGVVKVNADEIRYGAAKPVHINSLTLINKDSTISIPGNGSRISLNHDENFFTIGFSQPELVSPGNMSFSCRLKGFDKEWRDLGNSRDVAYTNVPPGDYEFELRSKEWNGSWSENIGRLDIEVKYPWYLKWWSVTLWIILFIFFIYACMYAYSYNRTIRRKFRLKIRGLISRIQESGKVRAIEIREMEPSPDSSEEKKIINEVIEKIEGNISDSNYSTDDLSRDVSVSRTKLYKIIQDETGRTPAVLIRDIRLKQASRLLINTELNISEISVMVGFGSLKYFNKYFKETFGTTPSAYRESKKDEHGEA